MQIEKWKREFFGEGRGAKTTRQGEVLCQLQSQLEDFTELKNKNKENGVNQRENTAQKERNKTNQPFQLISASKCLQRST